MTTLQHGFGFFGVDAKSHVIQNLQVAMSKQLGELGIQICIHGYMGVFSRLFHWEKNGEHDNQPSNFGARTEAIPLTPRRA